MNKVFIAKEFLTCALQRLEMEVTEAADHNHRRQINKAILSVNMAIDDLDSANDDVMEVNITEEKVDHEESIIFLDIDPIRML